MDDAQLVVYGVGGMGREIGWLVERAVSKGLNWLIACFIDDDEASWGSTVNGHPVLGLQEAAHRYPEALALAAAGHPRAREILVSRLANAGFRFATLIHPDVFWSRWNTCGEGSIIQAGSYVTTNITIGRHVLLNGSLTVGHDTSIGDFSTIGPGANVSGWVRIGRAVCIGTGATILNGNECSPLVVDDGAVIGAGACVIGDVAAGSTVVGVPARSIHHSGEGPPR